MSQVQINQYSYLSCLACSCTQWQHASMWEGCPRWGWAPLKKNEGGPHLCMAALKRMRVALIVHVWAGRVQCMCTYAPLFGLKLWAQALVSKAGSFHVLHIVLLIVWSNGLGPICIVCHERCLMDCLMNCLMYCLMYINAAHRIMKLKIWYRMCFLYLVAMACPRIAPCEWCAYLGTTGAHNVHASIGPLHRQHIEVGVFGPICTVCPVSSSYVLSYIWSYVLSYIWSYVLSYVLSTLHGML